LHDYCHASAIDFAPRGHRICATIPLGFLLNLKRFLVELQGVPGVSLTYRQDEITAHYLARIRDLTHRQLQPAMEIENVQTR